MSHSCVPNCAHSVFPNKTLALQAKTHVKAGEEFTIAYISPLQVITRKMLTKHDDRNLGKLIHENENLPGSLKLKCNHMLMCDEKLSLHDAGQY